MICSSCANEFLQQFVCVTCGAQKLHDHTLKAIEKENAALREELVTIRAATVEECVNAVEMFDGSGYGVKRRIVKVLRSLLTTGEKNG